MIHLDQWKPPETLLTRPALIVGKGPSADRLGDLDLKKFRVFTLNHAIKAVSWAVGAHFVDIEAYLDCQAEVDTNATFLFMPEHPHEKMTQGRHISDYIRVNDRLRAVDQALRLIVYRKVPLPAEQAPKNALSCLFFSAEALFNVVGILGFKTVYTIGIDGGSSYANKFSDLKPLTNGRATFDDQTPELKKIAKIRQFEWVKLFVEVAHAP